MRIFIMNNPHITDFFDLIVGNRKNDKERIKEKLEASDIGDFSIQ